MSYTVISSKQIENPYRTDEDFATGWLETSQTIPVALIENVDGSVAFVEIRQVEVGRDSFQEQIVMIYDYGYPEDMNDLLTPFDDYPDTEMPTSVTQIENPEGLPQTDAENTEAFTEAGDPEVGGSVSIDDLDFRYVDYTEWSDGQVGFIPDEDGNWYIVDLDGWYADPPGQIITVIPAGTFDREEDYEAAYIAYIREGREAMLNFIEETQDRRMQEMRDAEIEEENRRIAEEEAEQQRIIDFWQDEVDKKTAGIQDLTQEIAVLNRALNRSQARVQELENQVKDLETQLQNQPEGEVIVEPAQPMTASNLGFLAMIAIIGVVIYTTRTRTEG